MSKLYTRTGDMGTTSLVGGQRVAKDAGRLEAYGTVDEFNSWLGRLAASAAMPREQQEFLACQQHRLFNVGAYLATPVAAGEMPQAAGVGPRAIGDIESMIDTVDASLPRLNSFILPAGDPLAADCHVARTVCRRAERRVIALSHSEYVDPDVIGYLNRMSDYLFVLARLVNNRQGHRDTPWDPNV